MKVVSTRLNNCLKRNLHNDHSFLLNLLVNFVWEMSQKVIVKCVTFLSHWKAIYDEGILQLQYVACSSRNLLFEAT